MLVKYKIDKGEIANAYIDSNGDIALIKETKEAFVKSDKRIQMEMELAERLRSVSYEVVATVKDTENITIGYMLRDQAGNVAKVKKSTAILYASVDAISNAHVEFDGSVEYLVGNNISLENLAVVGGSKNKKEVSATRVANGVVNTDWQHVKDIKSELSNRENTDKRSELLDGMKYPKTTYLNRCKLTITVDNIDIQLKVTNLEQLVKDETDTLILEATYSDKSYRVMCYGANYIEMNCYMVALAGYLGIRELNRKAKLNEVGLRDEDGKMWRLFFKDDDGVVEEDNSTKIDAGMVRGLSTMYSISVSEISTGITDDEKERLVRGLRIGRATMRITCAKEYYDITEFVVGTGEFKRIDFTVHGSDGSDVRCYYPGLQQSKINIKNIIMICAASVSKMSEIRNVSVKAIGRESEYLVIFQSVIR